MLDEKPRYAAVKLIMLCMESDKRRLIIEFLEKKQKAVQLKDIVNAIKKFNSIGGRSTEHASADIGQDCRYMADVGLLKKIKETGTKGAFYQLNTEILEIINLFTDKINQHLQWEK